MVAVVIETPMGRLIAAVSSFFVHVLVLYRGTGHRLKGGIQSPGAATHNEVATVFGAGFIMQKRDVFRMFHFNPLSVLKRHDERSKWDFAKQSLNLLDHVL
jgi:hypothetical protein